MGVFVCVRAPTRVKLTAFSSRSGHDCLVFQKGFEGLSEDLLICECTNCCWSTV